MNQLNLTNLTPLETTLYETVLQGGRLTLGGIAKASNQNRSSLYPYIESLLQKGYLLKTVVGKRQYYSAASPEKIHTALKK
jgi:sugar-specific transcriptional regulator TrmB